ncbi:hypothetical protein RIF29_16709 [Crotalaria pallida]|uniref:HMA domain-containing protein n=1 Tax=Crotalaria pallida TaxID=3830 RepID=A0AAN9IFT4_CROPI
MSSQTVVLKVAMSCQGCAGAVNRALGKLEGVESFDIDLKEQKVTVKGSVEPETVLQTVSKTGKKTALWEEEAPVEPAEPENNPFESEAESENKPLKSAVVSEAEPENKPSGTTAVAVPEQENSKPSEAAPDVV